MAETFARRVVRIPIDSEGRAESAETFVQDVPLPDGLAFDVDGCTSPAMSRPRSCADPGRPPGAADRRPEAHLCHPTNVAFGTDLSNSNLGRWHITRTEVGAEAAAVGVLLVGQAVVSGDVRPLDGHLAGRVAAVDAEELPGDEAPAVEAMNSTASAISSGAASRPSGTWLMNARWC